MRLNEVEGLSFLRKGGVTYVTEQWVTAQWSYIVSNPDFCNHHWFGCALLSFIIGMHGGYFWRTKEDHRV
jgi:hypothetical protein